MTESRPDSATQPIDWEAFYRDYRKPGYIAGYEITSKLGGGMFGLVFKARKQSIGKDYAIKFLKVDDEEIRRALVAEMQAVRHFAQVDHPNLVSIEDRGEIDGIPYIVMTYAGDQTLRDRLDADDRDVEQLVLFFLQACRGVHALHERSLVHFDLKPANVFIRGNVARVGDYGLSKLVAHSRNTLSMGRGTPYYMAPEILQNKGNLRSDIYSLGVILFECLTGGVPFKGDSEWEVLRKHEQAEPDYPDDMAPLYRQVLGRCLAKDPADRYESVTELIAALTTSGEAGASGSPRPGPRARRVFGAGTGSGSGSDKAAEEDPFKDFREAARSLSQQAKKAATEAVRSAQVVGRRAIRQARYAVDQRRQDVSWKAGLWSARSWRRWRRRLHTQEFWRNWRRRRRERRPWIRPIGALALVLLVGLLAAGFFLMAAPRSASRVAVSSSSGVPSPRVLDTGFWIAPARRGDPKAPMLVRQALGEFRRQLPRSPGDLANRSSPLPEYPLQLVAAKGEVDRARAAAESVAAAESGAADALESMGYAGMVEAVQLLELQELIEIDGQVRAARLNEFLRRTLRFDGIHVTPVLATRGLNPYFALNDRAGQLWRWFVHGFASDPETYELYRKTMR